MKKTLTLILAAVLSVLSAAETFIAPECTNLLSLKVLLMPQKTGQEVYFDFEKQDHNGYGGPDNLSWLVRSPSGETVCEGVIPDDGNTKTDWKFGPKQKAVCRFIPKEEGIYQLIFCMSCDAGILFNNSTVRNLHWGIVNSNFRTGGLGSKGIRAWFYLPAEKAGEQQQLKIGANYMHYSKIRNMTLLAGDRSVYSGYNLPDAPDKRRVFGETFKVDRKNSGDLYQITADQFYIITFAPKEHSPITWFFDKKSAEAFKNIVVKDAVRKQNVLELQLSGTDTAAFAPGMSYAVEFQPKVKQEVKGTLAVENQKLMFAGKKTLRFKVPENAGFLTLTAEGFPEGKFLFRRIDPRETDLLEPVNGSVVQKNKLQAIRLLETEKNALYKAELVHESGKKIVLEGKSPVLQFGKNKLIPGVWTITAFPGKKSSCFAVAEPGKTSPVYAYDFEPVMDSSTISAAKITLHTLVSSGEIDLKKSAFLVNGKKYVPAVLGKNRIGVLPSGLVPGWVAVKADLRDKAGNRSVYEWGFMLGKPVTKKMSFDKNGYLVFNGRKFMPLILYPPTNNVRNNLGFNTLLPNTLTNPPTLDLYLQKNMKSLDSGCVFMGYYTAKDSTPLKDIEKYMKAGHGSHPARIGAWLDEADAHKTDPETKAVLQAYQKYSLDSGVAGVCTTFATRYEAMAVMGDYLMTDSYPNENVLALNSTFATAKKAAKGKPVWQLNQGFDRDEALRDPKKYIPNPAMMTYAHWCCFRHGLQGVGLYMCGNRADKFKGVFEHEVALYRQAASLAPVLMSPSDVKAECTSPLELKVMEYEGRMLIIVQNSSKAPCKGTVKIEGKYRPDVKVLFENRLLRQNNGTFHDVFLPLATHLYELEK